MGNANTTIAQKPLYTIPDPTELEIAASLALEAEKERTGKGYTESSSLSSTVVPKDAAGILPSSSSSSSYGSESRTAVSGIGQPYTVPVMPQEGSRMAILGHGLRVDDGYYDHHNHHHPSPSLPSSSSSLLSRNNNDSSPSQSNNPAPPVAITDNTQPPINQRVSSPNAYNITANLSSAPLLSSSSSSSTAASSRRIQWKRGELLGTGAYGRVYLGLNEHDGTLMAVKQVPLIINNHNYHHTTMGMGYHHSPSSFYDHHYLPPIHQRKNQRAPTSPASSPHLHQQDHIHNPTPDIITELQQEIDLMSRLSHENIVTYLGSQIDEYSNGNESVLSIFMEFVPGGSVTQLLRRFGKFNETLVKLYTRQILKGLAYLHSAGVIHRDVKGANVLVDRSGICKLSDFGSSKSYLEMDGSYGNSSSDSHTLNSSGAHAHRSLRGTPSFMAPEVVRQTGSGRKADIWSVGCTVIEMGTGRPPWVGYDNPIQAMFVIATSTGPPPIPDEFSPEGKEFLLLCLQRAPEERPTAMELLQHPFITGINPIPRPVSRGITATNTVKNMAVPGKEGSESSPEKKNTNFSVTEMRPENLSNPQKEALPVPTVPGNNVAVDNGRNNAVRLNENMDQHNEEANGTDDDEEEDHDDEDDNDDTDQESRDTLSTASMGVNEGVKKNTKDSHNHPPSSVPGTTNHPNPVPNDMSSKSTGSIASPPSFNPFSRSAAGKAKPALHVDITVPINRSSVVNNDTNKPVSHPPPTHPNTNPPGRTNVPTSPMAPSTTVVTTVPKTTVITTPTVDTIPPNPNTTVTTKPTISSNRFTFTIDESMRADYGTSPKGKKASYGSGGTLSNGSSSSVLKGNPSTTATKTSELNHVRNTASVGTSSVTAPLSILKSSKQSSTSSLNNTSNNENILSTDFLVDCIEDAIRDISYSTATVTNRSANNTNINTRNVTNKVTDIDTPTNPNTDTNQYPTRNDLLKTLHQKRSPFNRISPIATNVSLAYGKKKRNNASDLLNDSEDDEDIPSNRENETGEEEELSAESFPTRKLSGFSQTSTASAPFSNSDSQSNPQSPSHAQAQKPGFFQRMFSPIARKKGNTQNANPRSNGTMKNASSVAGEASPVADIFHQSTPRSNNTKNGNYGDDDDDDDDDLDDILTSTSNQRIYASLSSLRNNQNYSNNNQQQQQQRYSHQMYANSYPSFERSRSVTPEGPPART